MKVSGKESSMIDLMLIPGQVNDLNHGLPTTRPETIMLQPRNETHREAEVKINKSKIMKFK